ncbi:MAG: pyridoxamine 5'-phosphate oxidase family protein [Oscillospiraceae bacterium]|nr:pyridoxamine 5'-phosphate oxidase family protein [Oscillospiraceae bacterium]
MDEFERLWADIGTHSVMVLSTCADNRVTSRSMSVVIYGGRFYCQTNRNYLKCRQIENNPNVSLCRGNFTVEGICSIKGRPCDMPDFIRAMEKAFPDAVKRWSGIEDEVVLEITPVCVMSWIYENDVPYIESWNFKSWGYSRNRQL